jgi:hypothetical protein
MYNSSVSGNCMTEITATDDQIQAIVAGGLPVIVRDGTGNILGQLVSVVPDEHFTPGEIANALQSNDRRGKRYTTSQVLAHLRTIAPE